MHPCHGQAGHGAHSFLLFVDTHQEIDIYFFVEFAAAFFDALPHVSVAGGDVVAGAFVDGTDLDLGVTIDTNGPPTLIFTSVVASAKIFYRPFFLAKFASKPIQSPAPTCD